MQLFIQYFAHLSDNLAILASLYGAWIYVLLFLIIFCETGIILAAFLPGDSLLFAAGVVAASGGLNVFVLLSLLFLAALIGNFLNYWIGNAFGHWLFCNERSKIFKRSHLEKTHQFYERQGGKTIMLACFLPVLRTFAPFVAGMSNMNFMKFTLYNILGVLCWVGLLVYGSYLFGNIPYIKTHFTFFIFAIVAVSALPPFIEYARLRFASRDLNA